jgi:hypothetical protein
LEPLLLPTDAGESELARVLSVNPLPLAPLLREAASGVSPSVIVMTTWLEVIDGMVSADAIAFVHL